MRRFGWIGVSLVLVLAVVAGVVGYNLGMMHAAETAIASGGANVTYVVAAGGGFPFFPLLFGFLLFMVVVGFSRRAAWDGGRGRGGPGRWAGAEGADVQHGWCGRDHGWPTGPGGTTGSGGPTGPTGTTGPDGPSGERSAS